MTLSVTNSKQRWLWCLVKHRSQYTYERKQLNQQLDETAWYAQANQKSKNKRRTPMLQSKIFFFFFFYPALPSEHGAWSVNSRDMRKQKGWNWNYLQESFHRLGSRTTKNKNQKTQQTTKNTKRSRWKSSQKWWNLRAFHKGTCDPPSLPRGLPQRWSPSELFAKNGADCRPSICGSTVCFLFIGISLVALGGSVKEQVI